MLTEIQMRNRVIKIAWDYHGTPYTWGGDDPSSFDCSGLVIECLKSVGVLPRKGDWTANALSRMWKKVSRDEVMYGDLVFWHSAANENRVIHVEIMLDRWTSMGASGGGSRTLTIEDAIKHNAFVKSRPIHSRKNLWGFVNPYGGGW